MDGKAFLRMKHKPGELPRHAYREGIGLAAVCTIEGTCAFCIHFLQLHTVNDPNGSLSCSINPKVNLPLPKDTRSRGGIRRDFGVDGARGRMRLLRIQEEMRNEGKTSASPESVEHSIGVSDSSLISWLYRPNTTGIICGRTRCAWCGRSR